MRCVSTGRRDLTSQTANGGPGSDSSYYSWVLVREGDTWKIRRDTNSGTGEKEKGFFNYYWRKFRWGDRDDSDQTVTGD